MSTCKQGNLAEISPPLFSATDTSTEFHKYFFCQTVQMTTYLPPIAPTLERLFRYDREVILP